VRCAQEGRCWYHIWEEELDLLRMLIEFREDRGSGAWGEGIVGFAT
jgi:hypothetical protein